MTAPTHHLRPIDNPAATHALLDAAGAHAGWVLSFNPLLDREPALPPDAALCIVRSGWPDDAGPPAWLPGPRRQGEMGLDMLARQADGRPLVLWPRATDTISDIPSALTFLRARPAWRLLLDIPALLTPDAADKAPELAERIAAAFLPHPALWGAVLPGPGALAASLVSERLSRDLPPDAARVAANLE